MLALVIVFFVLTLTGCNKDDIEPEAIKLENKYIDLVSIYDGE